MTSEARDVRTKDCGIARASRSSLLRPPPVQRGLPGTQQINKDFPYTTESTTTSPPLSPGTGKSCLTNSNRQPMSVLDRAARGLCPGNKFSEPRAETVIRFDPKVTVHVIDEVGHVSTVQQELEGADKQFPVRPQSLHRSKSVGTCSGSKRSGIRATKRHSARARGSPKVSPPQKLYIHRVSSATYGSEGELSPDNSPTDLHFRDIGHRLATSGSEVTTNAHNTHALFQLEQQLSKESINDYPEPEVEEDTWMTFSLSLGTFYRARDIVVRATSSGRQIRVIATRSDDRLAEKVNQCYTVPVPVDPLLLSAKFDLEGILTVSAPVQIYRINRPDVTVVPEVAQEA